MPLRPVCTLAAATLLLSACANLDYQSSGASSAGAGVDDRVHGADPDAPASSVRIDCTGHPEWAGCVRDRVVSPDEVFRPRQPKT